MLTIIERYHWFCGLIQDMEDIINMSKKCKVLDRCFKTNIIVFRSNITQYRNSFVSVNYTALSQLWFWLTMVSIENKSIQQILSSGGFCLWYLGTEWSIKRFRKECTRNIYRFKAGFSPQTCMTVLYSCVLQSCITFMANLYKWKEKKAQYF